MGHLIHIFIDYLRGMLFQPKDHFERAKRLGSTRLLLPLILIVGGESAFVAILGAINTVEIESGNFFFRLVANSSESFVTLAIAILISFALYVGSNFYYASRLKQSSEQIEALNKELRRTDAYNKLKEKYTQFLNKGDADKAYIIAELMAKRYPNEVDMDSEFLESVISVMDTPQFAKIERMLIGTSDDKK